MTGKKIAVLATGGTLAGKAASAHDNVGYTAAQVGVDELLESIPALQGFAFVTEQVAQVDSKDMTFEIWRELAFRCAHWLAQDEIRGIVVTHGTDTLEETAFFLHRVLAPAKPLVLTCAMRPASALVPDGPQNIADAVCVALAEEARGVVAVCAGSIHGAVDVAKQHPYRLDAFTSGDAGPVGYVEERRLRLVREWPGKDATAAAVLQKIKSASRWPRVEIVMNHAGASGAIVDALVAQGVDGLVVAGTGNGTVSAGLTAALQAAAAKGVRVIRTTRCAAGQVIGHSGESLPASPLAPVKARIEMMLSLLP